jgi:hypothetical protein
MPTSTTVAIASSIRRVRATTEVRTPGQRRSMSPVTRACTRGARARRSTHESGARRKARASGSSKRRSPSGRADSSARKSAFCSAVRLARPRRMEAV